MVFRPFSLMNVTAFAKNLAEFITKRYPPVIANNPERVVSKNRIVEILDETFASAHRFHRENRLGMLGTAKLTNAFKGQLREFGYDENFVELATDNLKRRLARERS